MCGGTIINNKYVLTAAHCLVNKASEVFQVRLGEWNTKEDPDCVDTLRTDCADPVKNISVESIIVHEYYHARTKNNDIGLLKLADNITYSDYIRPICLASRNSASLSPGLKLVVSGWGMVENGTNSNLKLKTDVPLVHNKKCKEVAERNNFGQAWIGLNQMCAGGEEGKDACRGDSGGPLMRSYTNPNDGIVQWYQEGIVSWGMMCGNNPAVYTNVRKYRSWILSQLE
ncbi:hypothetical protein ILUMI_23892 [Ignelater luminosus]|uniref:Peptidase S1 domain-containing protein n=1 Tax=Ignelater luminosus TaxID=2038154 RepID=A0A8K0CBL5_IGNLU|nr:hypothetical protein ILUMI_23892 [Ignelater luminosus]